MLQRFLGGLTIAVLAVSFSGSHSSAGPLEDSLVVAAEDDVCTREFTPLRQEAEERGRLIKVASERHAPRSEACALIGDFSQAQIRMIRYVDANSSRCQIPPEIVDQLRTGHRNTEAMRKKICAVAQEELRRGPAGPVGDFEDTGPPPLIR